MLLSGETFDLADAELRLAAELELPTFAAEGSGRLYKRLTLIARAGTIVKVFQPVFPPDAHADEVLAWLREQPAGLTHLADASPASRRRRWTGRTEADDAP